MLNEDNIGFSEAPHAPSYWKFTSFFLILRSRSVSDFSHQSIKAVILCWAHLTTDPVRGKKFQAIQGGKRPAVAWRVSVAGCLKCFASFKVHFHLLRKVCIVCRQARKGKGTQLPTWVYAMWPVCLLVPYRKSFVQSVERTNSPNKGKENCYDGLEAW